ncbi:MAG TPA: hypothetical protein VGR28_11775 [Candidatus Thermoplasmatota archaeon]|jgi:hypothetical protein|nr:hypothetical protein [Candidatus Thermoplasmatota archaeon]
MSDVGTRTSAKTMAVEEYLTWVNNPESRVRVTSTTLIQGNGLKAELLVTYLETVGDTSPVGVW